MLADFVAEADVDGVRLLLRNFWLRFVQVQDIPHWPCLSCDYAPVGRS